MKRFLASIDQMGGNFYDQAREEWRSNWRWHEGSGRELFKMVMWCLIVSLPILLGMNLLGNAVTDQYRTDVAHEFDARHGGDLSNPALSLEDKILNIRLGQCVKTIATTTSYPGTYKESFLEQHCAWKEVSAAYTAGGGARAQATLDRLQALHYAVPEGLTAGHRVVAPAVPKAS